MGRSCTEGANGSRSLLCYSLTVGKSKYDGASNGPFHEPRVLEPGEAEPRAAVKGGHPS